MDGFVVLDHSIACPKREELIVRVLVVDDHPVVREGLRALLSSHDDIEVAGEAASGASAIRRAGYDSPDVVVMDVRLPDMSGVAACRTIIERFPDIKVLMLSSHVDEETVHEAILAGASGYLQNFYIACGF